MVVLRHAAFVSLTLLAACSAGPAPEPRPATAPPAAATSDASPPTRTASASASSAAPTPPPALEKSFTGQELPTIAIRNDYPVTQHVFVDGRLVGQVTTGTAGSFEVSVGVHTVTCADSGDPDDRPSSLTEQFDAGYAYRYRIVAK